MTEMAAAHTNIYRHVSTCIQLYTYLVSIIYIYIYILYNNLILSAIYIDHRSEKNISKIYMLPVSPRLQMPTIEEGHCLENSIGMRIDIFHSPKHNLLLESERILWIFWLSIRAYCKDRKPKQQGRRVTCDSHLGSLTAQGHRRLVGVTDDSKLGSLVPTGFLKGNT